MCQPGQRQTCALTAASIPLAVRRHSRNKAPQPRRRAATSRGNLPTSSPINSQMCKLHLARLVAALRTRRCRACLRLRFWARLL